MQTMLTKQTIISAAVLATATMMLAAGCSSAPNNAAGTPPSASLTSTGVPTTSPARAAQIQKTLADPSVPVFIKSRLQDELSPGTASAASAPSTTGVSAAQAARGGLPLP